MAKKILHAQYHRDNARKTYDPYTVILRYCFQQLKDIGKDDEIQDAQKDKLPIDGIKAKNSEMTIGKVSVMNDKENGGMTTEFDKDVSYLNNYVVANWTTHINLSAVDTNLERKI